MSVITSETWEEAILDEQKSKTLNVQDGGSKAFFCGRVIHSLQEYLTQNSDSTCQIILKLLSGFKFRLFRQYEVAAGLP